MYESERKKGKGGRERERERENVCAYREVFAKLWSRGIAIA